MRLFKLLARLNYNTQIVVRDIENPLSEAVYRNAIECIKNVDNDFYRTSNDLYYKSTEFSDVEEISIKENAIVFYIAKTPTGGYKPWN